jgi:hypothetical protein
MTNKNKTFFTDFDFILPSKASLKQIAKIYINKALRTLFKNIHINEFKENQLLGIILKVQFSDEKGSIRSISNMFRCDKTSYNKLLANLRELLISRSDTYKSMKVDKIFFSYHKFSPEYID